MLGAMLRNVHVTWTMDVNDKYHIFEKNVNHMMSFSEANSLKYLYMKLQKWSNSISSRMLISHQLMLQKYQLYWKFMIRCVKHCPENTGTVFFYGNSFFFYASCIFVPTTVRDSATVMLVNNFHPLLSKPFTKFGWSRDGAMKMCKNVDRRIT